MSKSLWIYGLHSGDDVIRYVGLTSQGRDRLYRHRYDAKRGVATPLYDWMRKHVPASIEMKVLETVVGTPEDLDAREIYWIAKLRSEGASLLNLTDGGRFTPGYTHSAETIAKMKANTHRLRGKDNPQYGTHLSPERRAEMSRRKMGKMAGEKHPNAKLTWAEVTDIRARVADGETERSVASRYGVTQANVSYIKLGKGWKKAA